MLATFGCQPLVDTCVDNLRLLNCGVNLWWQHISATCVGNIQCQPFVATSLKILSYDVNYVLRQWQELIDDYGGKTE